MMGHRGKLKSADEYDALADVMRQYPQFQRRYAIYLHHVPDGTPQDYIPWLNNRIGLWCRELGIERDRLVLTAERQQALDEWLLENGYEA